MLHRLSRRQRASCATVAAICAAVGAASPLHAVTKTWDNTGSNGVIDNGSGTWDTGTTANWTLDGGSSNTTWANNDDAVLGGDPGTGAAGTITLSGTINAASLLFNPAASGNFSLTGGTALNLTGTGGVITTNADASIASVIGGTVGITKKGASTLTLTAASTNNGAVAVNNGVLLLSGSGALLSASGYNLGYGGTLRLSNSGGTADRLAAVGVTMNGGTLDFIGASAFTETTGNFNAALGASTISLSGTGTTTLAFGTFTRTSGATINLTGIDSTHKVSFSGAAAGFLNAGAYVNGGDFAWYDTGTGSVRAPVYGTDTNTATTFTAGRHLKLGNTALPNGDVSILSLNMTSNVTLQGNNKQLTITTGGIIKSGNSAGTLGNGGSSDISTSGEWVIRTEQVNDVLTINRPVNNGTGLTKTGAGTLILGGGTSYSGDTRINQGILRISAADQIGNTSNLIINGGASFDLNGVNETLANLTMYDGAQITSTGTPTLTLNSNTSSITYSGDKTGATISVNRLSLASLNTAAVHNITVADGDAALDLDIQSIIQNNVANAQGIDKLGLGTLRLGAANIYTGATNITAGTLQLDGSTVAASTVNIGTAGTLSGTGTASGNATLTGNGAINFGSGGTIAGTLGVTGGNWSGQGGVTGTTTVSSGTFTVNGTMNGAGNVQVNNTAKLQGTGTLAKTVDINNGGTISPAGDGNVATTVGPIATNHLNLNPGGTYIFEVKDAIGSAGSGYDTVNVTNTVNVNAGTGSPNQFTVKINAYPGQLQNWNNQQVYNWDIVQASNVNGFTSSTQFVLDTSGFEDDYPKDIGSHWEINQVGTNIRVSYIPEPASITILGGLSLGAFARRRRRIR